MHEVNIETNGDFANEFGVQGIPALLLVWNGQCVDCLLGKIPHITFQRMVANPKPA